MIAPTVCSFRIILQIIITEEKKKKMKGNKTPTLQQICFSVQWESHTETTRGNKVDPRYDNQTIKNQHLFSTWKYKIKPIWASLPRSRLKSKIAPFISVSNPWQHLSHLPQGNNASLQLFLYHNVHDYTLIYWQSNKKS